MSANPIYRRDFLGKLGAVSLGALASGGLSGLSGTGKTTIATIIAAQGADDLYIQEFDSADQLSA